MKKRVRIISDLHGLTCWKNAIDDSIDLYLFQGDFLDAYGNNISGEQEYNNLKDIIEFKKQNKEKVILLLGNHCAHYRWIETVSPCSRFNPKMAYNFHFLYKENKDLFQVAYQIGNHLFTHAGISEVWYKKHDNTIKPFWEMLSEKKNGTGASLADVLNELAESKYKNILLEVGRCRGGYGFGGIFWADISETRNGIISGYHQVVGHSRVKKIEKVEMDSKTSITYCDTLNSGVGEEFLTIEI